MFDEVFLGFSSVRDFFSWFGGVGLEAKRQVAVSLLTTIMWALRVGLKTLLRSILDAVLNSWG